MKKDRHLCIAGIIKERAVSTQEELLSLLLKEGYEVTQATVSRDIKQLGLTKEPGADGISRYVFSKQKNSGASDEYLSLLKASVLKTDIAMNTVVLKCRIGTAQAACAALDYMNFTGVAGTLAGDDTIFCLAYDIETAAAIKSKIDTLTEKNNA